MILTFSGILRSSRGSPVVLNLETVSLGAADSHAEATDERVPPTVPLPNAEGRGKVRKMVP